MAKERQPAQLTLRSGFEASEKRWARLANARRLREMAAALFMRVWLLRRCSAALQVAVAPVSPVRGDRRVKKLVRQDARSRCAGLKPGANGDRILLPTAEPVWNRRSRRGWFPPARFSSAWWRSARSPPRGARRRAAPVA